MPKLLSGAEIVFKALEDQKVEYIFGYPGGAVLPIYDELKNHKSIKHILARHEQGAGHAAEGYARSSGKPGVLLVTSGPGATNAVTALTDAYMDSVPLVCISGQVPTHLIGTDAFQECDTTGITRPCTKHNWLVKDIKDLPKILHEAFHVATTGRPGPVLVDIPKDIQFAKTKYSKPKKENNSNGKELITSVVIGYEIACRLAMALGPHSSHEMGFHPTGTCSTFSGSAIIGRSRKMSEEEIVNAMGLNGSQAAGSMQYVVNGAWNKRTHPGINTHSSFIAATLAQSGFIGAAEVFEGKQGFLQGYALRPIPENATKTLGHNYETLENAIKPFPLCRYNHQTLDLVLDYQREYNVETSKISSILIHMPTYGVQLCGSPIELKRNPKSPVDAQFSGCFAAALALTQEKADMQTFTNILNTGMSSEFKRLLSITDIQQADDLDAIHPEFWPGSCLLYTSPSPRD